MGAARAQIGGLGRRFWLAAAILLAAAGLLVAFRTAIEPRDLVAWLIERRAFTERNLVVSAAAYFALYVAFAALSLPGAWAMSVAGGALFGPWFGVPLVSLSSTTGATVAMLAARYLFRDAVAERFPAFRPAGRSRRRRRRGALAFRGAADAGHSLLRGQPRGRAHDDACHDLRVRHADRRLAVRDPLCARRRRGPRRFVGPPIS